MKAVIPNEGSEPPCVVYWTGRIKVHVGVVTWCDKDRDANKGVLQVPDEVKTCTACNERIEACNYPKPRR